MFKFIKKLFFGEAHAWIDIEPEPETLPTVKLAPSNAWYVSNAGDIDSRIVYDSNGEEVASVAYSADSNRLELVIEGKSSPANITSRSCTTINSRLKKAGKEPISKDVFDGWENELIEVQGKGKGTYHSVRYPKK